MRGQTQTGSLEGSGGVGECGNQDSKGCTGREGSGRGAGQGSLLSKGPQGFKLLLEALWDAESISKALPSCCRSRCKSRNLN